MPEARENEQGEEWKVLRGLRPGFTPAPAVSVGKAVDLTTSSRRSSGCHAAVLTQRCPGPWRCGVLG